MFRQIFDLVLQDVTSTDDLQLIQSDLSLIQADFRDPRGVRRPGFSSPDVYGVVCTDTKRSPAFAARPPVAPCRTNAQTGDLLSAPRCLPCVQAARTVMRATLWPGKARLRYSGAR